MQRFDMFLHFCNSSEVVIFEPMAAAGAAAVGVAASNLARFFTCGIGGFAEESELRGQG